MSVEQTRGRLDCGLQGVSDDVSDERFRGIRIFDVSDLTRPIQVGAVQTCRGSHTHSVVTADDETIVVYNSGTSRIREEEELEGCVDDSPGDYRTALFRIDVIEIPVDEPSEARIVHSPAVFADPEDGTLAGPLWRGGRPRRPHAAGPTAPTSVTTSPCSRNSGLPAARVRATASCSTSPIP